MAVLPHHTPQENPREKLSAFVICYNEESNIADCLASLTFCDEVIVIDSFSTDRTVSIANSFGARVIQREWPGFRKQKAFGLSCATHQWVFNIDADERVSPELQQSIISVLEECAKPSCTAGREIVGYYVSRVVYYLGRWWRSGGWYPEYRLRLFRKTAATWGGVDPHEKAEVLGKTATLKGELYHFTYKSMDDHFERLHRYSTVATHEEFQRGKQFRLLQLLINPPLRFLKFYIFKRGYREGIAGFIVAVAEAHYTFMKYAKLWEKHFLSKRGIE